MQVVVETAVSHSCVVEKLVEIPENESASRQCGKLPLFCIVPRQGVHLAAGGGGLAASEGALDDEELFVIEGWMKPLLRQAPQCRS